MEVFVASDIDPSVGVAIEKTLNLAGEYWGLWWPVEYWVMGLEESAGRGLVAQFCSRRVPIHSGITTIAWIVKPAPRSME